MKNKLSLGICGALLLFGLFLAGCASLNNLLNPVHAINAGGEKVTAEWGSGKTVKVEGVEYPYLERPAVPPGPQKPAEPRKPSPPSWSGTNLVETGEEASFRRTNESFSSREELVRKIEFYRSQANRRDLSPADGLHFSSIVIALTDAFNFWEPQQKQYEFKIAQYQTDLPKYQQALKNYEQENAAYQAKLPEYQAQADAEARKIQDSINPSAPGNWNQYVEEKYLLYKGK